MDPHRRVAVENILAPTDFSDFAVHAVEHALVIAKAFGAKVTIIHVVPQTLMHPELFPYVEEPVVPPPAVREQAEARLSELVSGLSLGSVTIASRLEFGDTARRILMRAEKLPADLVVIGTHGRSGFERWLLGSVAERVLRKSRHTVLTVSSPPRGYRRIVCAVDFSDPSLAALDHAAAFATALDARLSVIHVAEGDEDSAELRVRLGEVAPEAADVVVLEGETPHEAVRRFAEEQGHDLIVAGSCGLGALDHDLLGSSINQLVRTAPCPVLTVPGRLRLEE